MKIIREGDKVEWELALDMEVELADGTILFPFTPHHVIRATDEIVDFSFPNFASVQCYSTIGYHLLAVASKFDLEEDWKKYDKLFIPHKHYKNGVRIVDLVDVWVVGVIRHDNGTCKLLFKMLD
jgi:hypothetical protein